MEFYLNRTGRPILFSCSWPAYEESQKTPVSCRPLHVHYFSSLYISILILVLSLFVLPAYPLMEYYLNATGRPILFSCSWPAYEEDSKTPVSYWLYLSNHFPGFLWKVYSLMPILNLPENILFSCSFFYFLQPFFLQTFSSFCISISR